MVELYIITHIPPPSPQPHPRAVYILWGYDCDSNDRCSFDNCSRGGEATGKRLAVKECEGLLNKSPQVVPAQGGGTLSVGEKGLLGGFVWGMGEKGQGIAGKTHRAQAAMVCE